MLTSLATGIRWSVKKAVKENFTTHPSSNSMYYIMFTVVMAAPTTLKQYIRDQKFLPKTSDCFEGIMYVAWQVLQSRCVVLFSMLWLSLAAIILPVFFLVMTHGLPQKKKRHKALEARQAAYAKYAKLLDWIETQHKNKLVQENFTYYTNYAYKLHNRMH